MISQVLPHLNFTVIIFATILFVDIAINFQKPLIVKFFLLSLVSCIIIQNLGNLLVWDIHIIILSKFLMTVSGLSFLYIIYRHQFSFRIIWVILFVLAVILANMAAENLNQMVGTQIIQPIRYFIILMVFAAITFLSFRIYKRMIYSLDDDNIYSQKIKKWSRIAIVLLSVGIINNLLLYFIESFALASKVIAATLNLAICIVLQYRPPFLNRAKLSLVLSEAFRKKSSSLISQESFTQIFYVSQYFLNKDANLQNLASLMDVNPNILNTYIYDSTKMTFSDFVNKCRIDYFVTLVSGKEYSAYSIEGLSDLAGFGSRHSLYRNFKRFHGGNPSDLIRSYE